MKEESVRTGLVVAAGSLAVAAIAAAAHWSGCGGGGGGGGGKTSEKTSSKSSSCCPLHLSAIPYWFTATARTFLFFLLGFCVDVLLVELGKVTSGVLVNLNFDTTSLPTTIIVFIPSVPTFSRCASPT